MLLHELKQAPLSAKIFKIAIKLGRPIPAEYSNAPEVFPWLVIYQRAFNDLIGDRAHEKGNITWMARQKWAEANRLDEVQTELLHRHIVAMDLAFLAYVRNKGSSSTPPSEEEKPDGDAGAVQPQHAGAQRTHRKARPGHSP